MTLYFRPATDDEVEALLDSIDDDPDLGVAPAMTPELRRRLLPALQAARPGDRLHLLIGAEMTPDDARDEDPVRFAGVDDPEAVAADLRQLAALAGRRLDGEIIVHAVPVGSEDQDGDEVEELLDIVEIDVSIAS